MDSLLTSKFLGKIKTSRVDANTSGSIHGISTVDGILILERQQFSPCKNTLTTLTLKSQSDCKKYIKIYGELSSTKGFLKKVRSDGCDRHKVEI